MKQLAFISLVLIGLSASAQKQKNATDSVYVSRNGITFRLGQKLMLGLGSGTDGYFRYVLGTDVFGMPDNGKQLPPQYATREVTVKRIKRQKALLFGKDNPVTVCLLFSSDEGTTYSINIEPALLSKELVAN